MERTKEALLLIEENKANKTPFLKLNGLGLRSIPKLIKDLDWLEILDLSDNKITNIEYLSTLSNLRELNLINNKISEIKGISRLAELRALYLGNNRINIVNWSSLKRLSNLNILDLKDNDIVIVPPEIFKYDFNIHWATILRGNPLATPPIEVIKQGPEAIDAYLQSLENVKPLNQVKALLIGDGGAGKTSLLKAIFDNPFDHAERQTHGINIQKRNLTIDGEDILASFWDFGGQEIMHATHKFFLTKRSIYLLVIDGRKEDKTEYWLKHVETFGGDSPVIIVINKADENQSFDLNRGFLLKKYPNIKAFVKISCKSKLGMKEFQACLKKEIGELELRNTPFASSWFDVMSALNGMKDDYISYNDYYNLCNNNKITDKLVQNTLLQFLHDLGVVLHFKELKLHDTQVLNPLWLTNAVYRIINSEDVAKNGGCLFLGEIYDVLNDKKWQENKIELENSNSTFFSFISSKFRKRKSQDYYYPENKILYILKIMHEFELCFRINDDTFIVPDLLPIGEKNIDFDYESSLKFCLAYDFMPTSILPRLMIQLNNRIDPALQWRTGVVIDDPVFNVRVVVKSDKEEKRISIWVKGENRQRQREFLSYIRSLLIEINNSFEKITYEELIPVPGFEELFINYQELVGYEEMGIKHYTIGRIRKTFEVDRLLSGIEDSMYRQIRKTKIKIMVLSALEDKPYRDTFFKTLAPLSSQDGIEIWDEGLTSLGESKRTETLKQINKADLVLFLVSVDLIADEELREWIEKVSIDHVARKTQSSFVLLRDCAYVDTGLKQIPMLNERSISASENPDKDWEQIYLKVKETIQGLKTS